MNNIVDEFKIEMSKAGLEINEDLITDGEFHAFTSNGDREPNSWYVFSTEEPAAGMYGCWKREISKEWCNKSMLEISQAERDHYFSSMKRAKALANTELDRVQTDCLAWCTDHWEQANDADNSHPYLQQKGIHSYGLRTAGDTLLVPLYSGSGSIQGMQIIQSDGTIDFKIGSIKLGSSFMIGNPEDPNTILICAGYANGASLHKATGDAVVVTFDAKSFKPIAESLRNKYPSKKLVICADDRYWGNGKTSHKRSLEAAKAVNGYLIYPTFENTTDNSLDFNDLHQQEGLTEVKRQIEGAPKYLVYLATLPTETAELSSDASGPDIYNIMSRAGKLKALDVKIEYVVEGLIPENMITVLYARSGMGKSTLMTQLCHAVSTGSDFMGLAVKQMECVYLDYENGLPVIVERLKKVEADTEAPFHIWHPGSEPPPPPLDKKEFISLTTIRPGSLVIVDTLKACNDADENNATTMKPVFDKLKQLRRHGLTVIVLHHTAKGNDGKFRGSSVIQDQADHCLVLHKVKKPGSDTELDDDDDVDTYRLGTKFKTRARPFRTFMEFNKESELFKNTDDPSTSALLQLQSIIVELYRYSEPTQRAIIDAVGKSDILESLGRDAVRTLLKKGEGIYWQSERRPAMKNALVYIPMPAFEHSEPYIAIECSNTDSMPSSEGSCQ